MNKLIGAIANIYGIDISLIQLMQSGYRNQVWPVSGMDARAIIIYKSGASSLDIVRKVNYLGRQLASRSLPVRSPIGKIVKISDERYACIYNYLPGTTIAWEAYSMKHIKAMGKMLATLHDNLQTIARTSDMPNVDLVAQAKLAKMIKYWRTDDIRQAMTSKLKITINLRAVASFTQLFDKLAKLSQTQILHLDYVRGNVLFEPNSTNITGIIDFEKAAVGHIAYDLARTLAFLSVDVDTKSQAQLFKYLVSSGYCKNSNVKINQKLILALCNHYWLVDLYNFMRHNPYENLSQNHHYVRTVELLAHNQLIRRL